MLTLSDFWVWDSWSVTHEGQHHLFFLKAPKSLGDPDKRHFHPTVGHAVSADFRTWRILPDALRPADGPAWDDYTTWTGSIVRGPSGRWHMFYTGTSRGEQGLVQRVGRADSDDRGAPSLPLVVVANEASVVLRIDSAHCLHDD
jgi:beta-fructofuranosidase